MSISYGNRVSHNVLHPQRTRRWKPASASANSTISPTPEDASDTKADDELPMSSDGPAGEWQTLISDALIEWSRDQPFCEDDGVTFPSEEVINTALQVAQLFMQNNVPAPDRVVPDPDGGIVFERHVGDMVEVLHIWDDATAEVYCLKDGRMIERFPIRNS